jgi:hypothetical protein
MKIAFYSNSNQLGVIPLRLKIFQAFKDNFNKQIDYFTSDGGLLNIGSKEVNRHFKDSIVWGEPSPDDYDILMLPFLQSKKNKNYNQIAKSFKLRNKNVIQIQCTNCFDVEPLSESLVDQYIIASETYRKNIFLTQKKCSKVTISSILDSYVFIDQLDFLPKNEFYKKYEINKSNNIVGLFPTRVDRIKDMSLHDGSLYEFYKKLNEVNNTCKEEGTEILMKPHRWEIYGNKVTPDRLRKFGFKSDNPHNVYLKDIKKIEPIDYISLLKYSKVNIVMMSTMIFSMYLTKKPTHYAGPIWTCDRTFKIENLSKDNYNSMINGFHFSKASENMSIKDISNVIKESINNTSDYQFRYQEDHPIFGNILNLSLESYLYNLNKSLESL